MRITAPIAIVLLLFSCSPGEEGPPTDLIPKEKFIPLAVDLKVLEEHYHRHFMRPDAYAAALDSASYFIFEDYGVTKAEFHHSLNYYSEDPFECYTLFESVLDTINMRVTGQVEPDQAETP